MTNFLEIVPEKLCAKISYSYEIFLCQLLVQEERKKN